MDSEDTGDLRRELLFNRWHFAGLDKLRYLKGGVRSQALCSPRSFISRIQLVRWKGRSHSILLLVDPDR
jgi:hypothetical protein